MTSEQPNLIDFNRLRNLVRDQEVDGSNPFAFDLTHSIISVN